METLMKNMRSVLDAVTYWGARRTTQWEKHDYEIELEDAWVAIFERDGLSFLVAVKAVATDPDIPAVKLVAARYRDTVDVVTPSSGEGIAAVAADLAKLVNDLGPQVDELLGGE
jgi:hypothetical protein